jgi:hypothetical protein
MAPSERTDMEHIPQAIFATDENIKRYNIGLGDEISIIGLFTNFIGTSNLSERPFLIPSGSGRPASPHAHAFVTSSRDAAAVAEPHGSTAEVVSFGYSISPTS